MAQRSRLSIAKDDIFAHFDAAQKSVYTQAEMAGVLNEQRSFWRLALRTSTLEFITFLVEQRRLTKVEFRADEYNQIVTRYAWGSLSPYSLAISLRKSSYLSHGTAVSLHGLTDLIPKTIYLNIEQSPKPRPRGELTQAAVNRAFANKQRQSNLTYKSQDWAITVISGKNTGRLGVEAIRGPQTETVDATNLERTLIDIVVRPAYAGGIFQVLQAYKAAKREVSTNRLVSTLKKLDYVYPYHQAIGFLMERAGYEANRYELLSALGTNLDFHLTHGVQNPDYDKKWRLFFPKGLELTD